MRFVVDAQLPPALAAWLRAKGHDANHVADLLDARASDRAILDLAAQVGAVIITKDWDFLDFAPETQAILFVRLGNTTNRALLAAFDVAFPQALTRLESGETIVPIG
ncbi:MAG: DUF5615 family PIN-like protein [Caulobacterales bacterium]